MYVKKKNNNIHVCTDFSTGLNECLLPPTYLLASPEKIFSKFNGRRVFQKLTCQTHTCKLKWMKNVENYKPHAQVYIQLPSGVKVASSIFQQVMDMMLAGLDFTVAYLDNVLIKSETRCQHLNRRL